MVDDTKCVPGTDIPVDSVAGEELMRQRKILDSLASIPNEGGEEPIYSNNDMYAEIERRLDEKNIDELDIPEDSNEFEQWRKDILSIYLNCTSRRRKGSLLKPESTEQIPQEIEMLIMNLAS